MLRLPARRLMVRAMSCHDEQAFDSDARSKNMCQLCHRTCIAQYVLPPGQALPGMTLWYNREGDEEHNNGMVRKYDAEYTKIYQPM